MEASKPGYLLVIHSCRDFARWKKGYAIDLPDRTAASLTQMNLMQSAANPQEVVILFKYTDASKVKSFIESPSLKAHMEVCGVVGQPQVLFLNDAK